MTPTTDTQVLIAGGGVAGVCLLHALARRGIAALLVEQGRLGARGASSIPVALLNPHRGRTGRANATDLDGLAAFWRLAEALDIDGHVSGARRSGVLRVAASARQASMWRRLTGPEQLAPDGFPAHVRAPYGGVLVPDGGWLEPRRFMATLSAAATEAGGSVREGVALTEVWDGPVRGANTSLGAIRARHVVLCLGAYDAARLRLPRLDLAPGVAVTFDLGDAAPPLAERSAVTGRWDGTPRPLAGAVGIVFRRGSTVVMGAAHTGTMDDVERVRSSASWFVPALSDARVTHVWRGVRARRPSGAPVVRRLRPGLTLFGALGGRGFLCSPWLAERLAERLADDLSAR